MSNEKELLNDNIVNEDINENEEDGNFDDIEYALALMQLEEEAVRTENFAKKFDPSKEALNSEIYRNGIVLAETIVGMTKCMVEGGLDYNNALTLTSNYITSKQNIELAKVQQIQAQQSQI